MEHTPSTLIPELAGSGSARAQPATTSTPTTRILAIGTSNPGRSSHGVRDSADRGSGDRQLLPGKQDRPIVFAAGSPGRGRHPECHGPHCCARDARRAAAGPSSCDDVRTNPAWATQPASPTAWDESKSSVRTIDDDREKQEHLPRFLGLFRSF
jgi:hypothetical protein